ncbi:hypothetical protein GCM10010129_76380 [Streptomyces fumigatiscleroticus]|nr:hypothetical protein GCM10010129_76380 [Streptomyces fumigatiscleroticus]
MRFGLRAVLGCRGFTLVTYVTALDVPRHIVGFFTRLLARRRRRLRTPRGSGPFRQAALALRWFREHGCVHCLARDVGISTVTDYRYLHEDIDVLADQAPALHEPLTSCQASGMTHLVLDGTRIERDRVAGARGRHKAFDGAVQFLSAPDGATLWVSEVEPDPSRSSPRPGSIPCPPRTRRPPEAFPPSRTRATPATASKATTAPGAPAAAPSRPSTSTPACETHSSNTSGRPASAPRRTSKGAGVPPHTSFARAGQQHRPRRSHPQRPVEMISVQSTSRTGPFSSRPGGRAGQRATR